MTKRELLDALERLEVKDEATIFLNTSDYAVEEHLAIQVNADGDVVLSDPTPGGRHG
jgi:hypothetical protein